MTLKYNYNSMQYKSLNDFVSILKKYNLLIEIEEFVDPILEIAEITDRISKQPFGGQALLFKNTGTKFPVLTNFLGSEVRLALALRSENFEQLGQGINLLFQLFTKTNKKFFQKLETLLTLRKLTSILPKSKKTRGTCQEVIIRDPDLFKLPILKLWPEDGGRFITFPLVHTKDPLTGQRNVGMYRVQVFEKDLAAMHWHRHKTGAMHFEKYKKIGKRMPIAIALGGDPVYTYVATAPLPENLYEYILAGYIRHKSVNLVKCITQDIEVPEDADIVIEGYIDPEEDFILEGPFGDHTGFYSKPDFYPRLHITAITHRKDAIYPATIVGVPPQEDAYLAKASERIFISFVKNSIAMEIADWDIPFAGCGHNFTIVQIRKRYPGQGKKVINTLWGAGQMMFNKIMIIISQDIDIHDYKQVLRLVIENVNSKRDFIFAYGPSDVLDHASEKFTYGSKLGIDATEKLPEELENNSIVNKEYKDLDYKALVDDFEEVEEINIDLIKQNIPVLIILVKKQKVVKELVKDILNKYDLSFLQYILVLDNIVPSDDFFLISWLIGNNIAPKRDIFFIKDIMIIDGTIKRVGIDSIQEPWPKIAFSDKNTIKRVDAKWSELGIKKFIPSPSLKFYKK